MTKSLDPHRSDLDPKTNAGALASVRVLELSHAAAAVTGRILADLGADVIKIEPSGGEPARWQAPAVRMPNGEQLNPFWLAFNVSKRSITLDLDTADGLTRFTTLARAADIVITDFQRLNLQEADQLYGRARASNPAIVWAEVWPFGRGAPFENHPAGELVLQALGGHLCLNGDIDRPPVRIGLPVGIMQGGAEAASAALMAYFHRLKSGCGQRVDISIQQCVTWTLLNSTMIWQLLEINEIRGGAVRMERTNKFYTRLVWPCADGYITIAPVGGGFGVVRERSYAALVAWMAEESVTDELLTSRDWNGKDASRISQEDYDRVAEIIGAFIQRKTKNELMERAVKHQILLAEISGIKDLFENPHLRARALYDAVSDSERKTELEYPAVWAKLSKTPLRKLTPPPKPGEHDAQIWPALTSASAA
jgi:crotonobetainyl-CoA:carnitine CoA-transferase CaiB-like acyl-CoA transferase